MVRLVMAKATPDTRKATIERLMAQDAALEAIVDTLTPGTPEYREAVKAVNINYGTMQRAIEEYDQACRPVRGPRPAWLGRVC